MDTVDVSGPGWVPTTLDSQKEAVVRNWQTAARDRVHVSDNGLAQHALVSALCQAKSLTTDPWPFPHDRS